MDKKQIDTLRQLRAETGFPSVRQLVDHLIEKEFDRSRRGLTGAQYPR